MLGEVIWFDKIDMNGLLECEDGNRRYFDSRTIFKNKQQVEFDENLEFNPTKFAVNVSLICNHEYFEFGHCIDCGESRQ